MAHFGLATSHRRGRLAGRSGGALWVAWIAVVAFVLLQISITLMPMPAVAASASEDGDLCASMMMDSARMDMAMGGDQAPAQDANHGGTVSCPLMKVGGCFAMCATVLPSPPVVPPTAVTAMTRQFAVIQGAPLVVSPPQRPPRRT